MMDQGVKIPMMVQDEGMDEETTHEDSKGSSMISKDFIIMRGVLAYS